MPRTVFEFAVGARRHQRDVLADVSHLDATSVDRERPRNVRQIWRTNRVVWNVANRGEPSSCHCQG